MVRASADLTPQCPEQVSVVSIDDFDCANPFRPRHTTVAQPVAAMGETAVRLLHARITGSGPDEARAEVMAPMLIVRESCTRPGVPSPTDAPAAEARPPDPSRTLP